MASSAFVDATVEGLSGSVVVQGFRGDEPYVFIGFGEDGEFSKVEVELTPENAHILSEELRKHAEFSTTKGE